MDKNRGTEKNNDLTMVKLPDGRIVNMDFEKFKENLESNISFEGKTNKNQELN